MVLKEDMFIGGIPDELASAKADVAELKDGDDERNGNLQIEEAGVMKGESWFVLRCKEFARKFSLARIEDVMRDESASEDRTRLGWAALLGCSKSESIVTHFLSAKSFPWIGCGHDREGCGCSKNAKVED